MSDNMKQKLPLIIGIGLPSILIVAVILFAYILPGIFINPMYDFVYAVGNEKEYLVLQDGTVDLRPCPYDYPDNYRNCTNYPSQLNFYLYDSENEKNTPISLEEIQKYELDLSDKSPDGYNISYGGRGGGEYFLFPVFWGGGSSNTPVISKGSILNKPLNLRTSSSSSYYNFKFIGWILK